MVELIQAVFTTPYRDFSKILWGVSADFHKGVYYTLDIGSYLEYSFVMMLS